MDLEEFDNIDEHRDSPVPTSVSPENVLEYIDDRWYTKTNRRGRWMDLLGDYAGSESFIIDGMIHLPMNVYSIKP